MFACMCAHVNAQHITVECMCHQAPHTHTGPEVPRIECLLRIRFDKLTSTGIFALSKCVSRTTRKRTHAQYSGIPLKDHSNNNHQRWKSDDSQCSDSLGLSLWPNPDDTLPGTIVVQLTKTLCARFVQVCENSVRFFRIYRRNNAEQTANAVARLCGIFTMFACTHTQRRRRRRLADMKSPSLGLCASQTSLCVCACVFEHACYIHAWACVRLFVYSNTATWRTLYISYAVRENCVRVCVGIVLCTFDCVYYIVVPLSVARA